MRAARKWTPRSSSSERSIIAPAGVVPRSAAISPSVRPDERRIAAVADPEVREALRVAAGLGRVHERLPRALAAERGEPLLAR